MEQPRPAPAGYPPVDGGAILGDISAADEIYIVCSYTDIRRSIDGLCGIVQDRLHMDPHHSAIYLFSAYAATGSRRLYNFDIGIIQAL